MKVFGKVLLILLSVFGGFFLLLVALAAAGMFGDEEAELPAAETTPQPVMYHYSPSELQQWIEQLARQREASGSRCYSLEDCDADTIRSEIGARLKELYEQDPFFAYSVENVEYTTTDYEQYLQADLTIYYDERETPFEELLSADSRGALLQGIQPALDRGETSFYFLLRNPVTTDDVTELALELAANSVELPVESSSYRAYLTAGDKDEGYALVNIELFFRMDESQREQAGEELRLQLDEMAEELRQSGQSGRDLYRAVARAVAARTEYDDDARIATYRDDLSDEQKMIRSAYGAVVSGKTVCSGYAMAFKALCDRLGLPCWVVNGYLEGGYHAWDMVELDGETLFCDCTALDALYDESYLFMDEATLERRQYYYSVNQLVPWEAA